MPQKSRRPNFEPDRPSVVSQSRQEKRGATLDDDTKRLLDRWIIAFLDPPSVLDPDLMRLILEEHEATKARDAA